MMLTTAQHRASPSSPTTARVITTTLMLQSLLLLFNAPTALRAADTFASITTAPYAFVALINQHRMARCPHLKPYEGATLTGAFPILFSADGAPVMALTEVRAFGPPGGEVRSRVYRAEVSASNTGLATAFSVDEATLVPSPCEDKLELAMTFDPKSDHPPFWLTDPNMGRMLMTAAPPARKAKPTTPPSSSVPSSSTPKQSQRTRSIMEEEEAAKEEEEEKGKAEAATDFPPSTTPFPVEDQEVKKAAEPAPPPPEQASPIVLTFKNAQPGGGSKHHKARKLSATTKPTSASATAAANLRQSSSPPAIVFDGITLPTDYSTMDTYVGATPCKAFRVVNQGSTMGCAVYTSTAVMGARMCLLDRESSIDNVVFSARQNGDCASSGWTTSGSIDTFKWQTTSPGQMVQDWCAPLNGTNEGPCDRGICPEGMRYGGIPGSAHTIFGIPAIMAEILKNGPVGARVLATSAFMNSYGGGVFSVPFDPADGGSYHKMSLVGWGSTPEGVPYWTVQNSWGVTWGEKGYGRILRGQNVLNIEAEGVETVKPNSSAPKCAGQPACNVWTRTLGDCSCACNGTFRVGAQCEVCPADTCLNGGQMLDPSCSRCTCPYGRFGARCELGVDLLTRRWAVCQPATAGALDMSFEFDANPNAFYAPPRKGSMVAFYPPGYTSVFGYSLSRYVCGTGPITERCPTTTGSITVPNAPSTPNVYKVYLLRAVEFNGATSYYMPTNTDHNIHLGDLHVLASTHDACQGTPEANALLDSLASFTPPITAAANEEAARAAASAARLAAAQQAIDQIKAQWATTDVVPSLPISIYPEVLSTLSPQLVEDILPTTPGGTVWAFSMDLYRACPVFPPQLGATEKRLTLTYANLLTNIVNGLGPNANAATWTGSADIGKCTELRFNGPTLTDSYNLAFYHTAQSHTIATFRTFKLKNILFNPRPWVASATSTTVTLRTTFQYQTGAVPMLLDTLKLYDVNGVMTDMVYTYCRCKTPPTGTSVPAAAGVNHVANLLMVRIAAGQPKRSPYVVKFHRANTAAVVGVGVPNVVWANFPV